MKRFSEAEPVTFPFYQKRLASRGFPLAIILTVILAPTQTLTHRILVDSSIFIRWTSPFVILGVPGLFCRFNSIFDGDRGYLTSV